MTAAIPTSAPGLNASISRRSLFVGMGLLGAAGATAALTPRVHEVKSGAFRLEDALPEHVGGWSRIDSGDFVLPEDTAAPTQVYDQVATRSYAIPDGPEIMVLLAYGAAQSGLMDVHQPEVCYASAGFAITDFKPVDIPLGGQKQIAGEEFIGARASRREHVLYWTRISSAFPRGRLAQRIAVLERGLVGVIPDGILVRISSVDETSGHDDLLRFAREFIATSGPVERRLILGRGA